MAINQYDQGSLVRVSATFTVNGVVTDPTGITLTVSKQDGTTATYTFAASQVTRDSAGKYHVDLDTTGGVRGPWRYEWSGTAPAQAAADGVFYLNIPF